MQNKKLFHHANLLQLYKFCDFFEQDKCFWLQIVHVLVQSSMKNNHSCYYSLFQICWDKTHTERFCYKLIEYSDSDQYVNKYSISDKMIYKAMNSAAISADRIAAI